MRLPTARRRVLNALAYLGRDATNREVAKIAKAGPSGDVATVLCALARDGLVERVGTAPPDGKGKPASIWRLAGPTLFTDPNV